MGYLRRVVKRRTPFFDDPAWLEVFERGKLPREQFLPGASASAGRVDVSWVCCWFCGTVHGPAEVELCMSLPRLSNAKASSASSTSSALVPGPLRQFSELWAFLTQTVYEDGSRRLPGKLALSCESGQLGLCLTDGDTGQYAFLNGTDLELLLLEAETRLGAGTVAFKPSKYAHEGRRRKGP